MTSEQPISVDSVNVEEQQQIVNAQLKSVRQRFKRSGSVGMPFVKQTEAIKIKVNILKLRCILVLLTNIKRWFTPLIILL